MREIICADALVWGHRTKVRGAVVTSLPDAAEVGMGHEAWSWWFREAALMAMVLAADAAPAIFYQTDRKADGQTYSKARLLMEAAGDRCLLWHKIVLRRRPGAVDLHRPGFSHLMAFTWRARPGAASPDVLEAGPKVYPNATGLTAARWAVAYAGRYAPLIIDPFCGRGTIPAMAESLGLNAIGVDIDPAQCAAARKMVLAVPAKALI
jgi:adenine-specific DNA methylase